MSRMSLLASRYRSYRAQGRRCHYCGAPIWLRDLTGFARLHRLPLELAARLQCTAEHLVARRDGGTDARANIVAACVFCNTRRHARRHPLSASAYRELVARRMAQGKWHPREIHQLLRSLPDPGATRPVHTGADCFPIALGR
ncbi:HNH endonuclease [Thiococcus pfennigii]|uniref:HNH endonuclease n=1 Tax=Thiococcus pfennigii TaxID=1057 RepID=UPI001903533D|nr:HNH endonuclease [Thiococcus pfennigii]